jgi:hypothetical protein
MDDPDDWEKPELYPGEFAEHDADILRLLEQQVEAKEAAYEAGLFAEVQIETESESTPVAKVKELSLHLGGLSISAHSLARVCGAALLALWWARRQ